MFVIVDVCTLIDYDYLIEKTRYDKQCCDAWSVVIIVQNQDLIIDVYV